MAALLDTWVIWNGLGWLCFVGLTLLSLALLFPRPDPSRHTSNGSKADSPDRALPEELPVTKNSHR